MLVISPKQPLLFPVQPLSDKKQRYPGVLGSDTLKKVPIYLQLFYFLINVPFFREILSVSADSYRFPRILIGFREILSVSAKSYRFRRILIGFREILSVSAKSYRFPRILIGFRGILSVSAKSYRFPRNLAGFRAFLFIPSDIRHLPEERSCLGFYLNSIYTCKSLVEMKNNGCRICIPVNSRKLLNKQEL